MATWLQSNWPKAPPSRTFPTDILDALVRDMAAGVPWLRRVPGFSSDYVKKIFSDLTWEITRELHSGMSWVHRDARGGGRHRWGSTHHPDPDYDYVPDEDEKCPAARCQAASSHAGQAVRRRRISLFATAPDRRSDTLLVTWDGKEPTSGDCQRSPQFPSVVARLARPHRRHS